MPAVTRVQLGVKDETTWNTPVVVDRFFEFAADSSEPDIRRIESRNMRAGSRVQRADRWVPWRAGATAEISADVLSKGWAWWLKHMLGTSGTTGPTDSAYVHTGTIGDLRGDSFTMQSNKPLHPADSDQPFTYSGCKITRWELGCTAAGLLEFMASIDAADFSTATSLASASYPTGAVEPFSFIGATLTIGGSAYNFAESFRISCDNGLRTDEYRLRGSGLKSEQQEVAFRAIEWSIDADFDSLTQANRVYSATAAGAMATIVATFEAPTLIGATSKPLVVVTIDQARFDAAPQAISGPDPLKQRLSGKAVFSSNSAVTVAVTNADATA